MLQAPDKTCRLSLSALFSVPFKYSVQHCVYIRLHVTCIHSPPHFRLFASTPHNSNLIVVFPWSFELSGVDCNWDPRSTDRESRIHSVESRIQDCLGFPYVRQSAFKVKWPGTTQDEWPTTKTHTPKHRKYERKKFPRKWALFSTVVQMLMLLLLPHGSNNTLHFFPLSLSTGVTSKLKINIHPISFL